MGLGEKDLGVKYCSSTHTPHDLTHHRHVDLDLLAEADVNVEPAVLVLLLKKARLTGMK